MQPMQTLDYQPRAMGSFFRFDTVAKGLVVLMSAVAALPAGILLHTYVCFFAAAHFLGHFPSYGRPDPQTLPPNIMFGEWLMPFGSALTIATIVALCFVVLRSSMLRLLVAFGCAAIFWILLIVDLGGAFSWIMD